MVGALDYVASPNEDKLTNSNVSLHNQERSQNDKAKSSRSRCSFIFWNVFIDLPLLLLFTAALLVFSGHFVTVLNYKAGFFCNDPSLSHPFKGDTVSASFLLSSVVVGPLIVMLIIELIKSTKNTFHTSASERVRHAVIETFKVYRTYVMGFLMNITFVMMLKSLMGRPRPNFFDACQPDTARTCNGSEFVSSFTCTSRHVYSIQLDSYQSFPSGHTSTSVYAGLFTALYLQYRTYSWRNRSALLIPTLQFLCIIYSTICSFTRITDHRHHWWDVLAGAAWGFGCVYYVVIMQLDKFRVMKRSRISYDLPTYENSNVTNSTDNIYVSNQYSIKM